MAYGFMVMVDAFASHAQAAAWGGYVYIINIIPLHVFVCILLSRLDRRMYIAYSVFYVLAVALAMQVQSNVSERLIAGPFHRPTASAGK